MISSNKAQWEGLVQGNAYLDIRMEGSEIDVRSSSVVIPIGKVLALYNAHGIGGAISV